MDTIFETPRLRVRPWRESDAEALFRYASEPEVGERAGWPPHESIEDSIKVIREVFSNGHTFAMELKETGEAIGCICYYDHTESNIQIGEEDAEIGYWIGKPYWNQGLGTEALRGMVGALGRRLSGGWSTGVSTRWDSIRFGATTSLTTPLPDVLWRNAASGTPAR